MSSSSDVRSNVRHLKESLIKTPPADTDRLLDILRRLDESDVDLGILTDTLVGAAVSKLKCNGNEEVADRAKMLVKKWRRLAKDGQAGRLKRGGSGRSLGSASSASKPSSSAKAAAAAASGCTADAEAEAEAEWAHLPPLRKSICNKMRSVLLMSQSDLTSGEGGLDHSAVSHLCTSRAGEVEGEIQSLSKGDSGAYKEKARSLVFNLKKNSPLRERILFGQVQPSRLVRMSPDELATADTAARRAKMVSNLQDSRRLDWEQANEARINEQCGIKGDLLKASLFTCGRCNSIKTTSTQKQTRSADEPMTVFVLCLNCGNRWKC